jgi:hypothetical protein
VAALNIRLSDGTAERVEIMHGDIDRALQDLQNKTGEFSTGWVRLIGGEVYVQHHAIIRVEVVRD